MPRSDGRRRYLTLKVASEYTEPPTPVPTLRLWIAKGLLPASRPGKHVLIREDHLLAVLDGLPVPTEARHRAGPR